MTKTQCSKCIFSNDISSNPSCEFNIPEKIKSAKNISVVNNFYEIDDYRCLYGFSKNQYNKNIDNLKDIDMQTLIKEKTDIKYYLLLDARQISEKDLYLIINKINKLNIKPKHFSIILNPNNPDESYRYIKDNLSSIRWTIHVFVDTLPLNDCINTILDTNLSKSESWCVLFIDAKELDIEIQSIVNKMQTVFIIEQKNFYGIKQSENSLHMLCLNCYVYKTLVSTMNRNILESIKSTPELILETYDTK